MFMHSIIMTIYNTTQNVMNFQFDLCFFCADFKVTQMKSPRGCVDTVVSTLYLYFRVKANGYICLIILFKEVVNLPSSAALQ